ncbi:hypothetical protein M5K25_013786 [Dendrobium thyrsiflorum]|uniref:FHA domain-containing protein n=1 Tax=Dendrobium thyrsiflorum TaxID=117978 RepID=A0ABD0UUD0_DENTH
MDGLGLRDVPPSMENPTLSLSIESGPKKGVTLECKPGDQLHIGRVVRGNALSIRDPSISQKHLVIRFLPEINRWAVTDLDSSNGTYVNGALISPDNPSPLLDGDIIRIGEKTSIAVHVSASQAEVPPLSRHGWVRRRIKEIFSWEEQVNEQHKIGGRVRADGRKRNREDFQPVVMKKSKGRVTKASARASSTRISEMKLVEEDRVIVTSDSDSAEGAEKEKPLKQTSVGAEEEEPSLVGEQEARDKQVEGDMDSMTMGEWIDRMEEYIPKTINRVAESIIAKLNDKAHLFDEYVAQTLNGKDE